MKFKSFFTLSAASLALLAGACGDDPKPSNPSTGNDPTVCDTCAVTPPATDSIPAEGPITLPEGKGMLLDDFESGTNFCESVGDYWYTYDDSSNGGASKIITPLSEDGYIVPARVNNGSNYAFKVVYTLDKGDYEYDPYVGWGVQIAPDDENARFGGITYWYKGGAHEIHVETTDAATTGKGDVHLVKVSKSTVWKQVTVRFKDMLQGGWGKEVDFVAANIKAVSFQAKGSRSKVTTDSVFIDNIYLQDTSEVAPDVKDLTINDPAIPEVSFTEEEIKVTNPLQEKAAKYLNKGVNFTNWLEESNGKFKEFKFGEKDVKILAESGFKSLRLPIDLDLYATNKAEFLAGKAKTLEFDDDTLFLVLDSFDKWTKENGMSFVIDYHEYDNGYNTTTATDTLYNKMMASVWQHVAKHFATSEREDIFFELLNEPDMSNGKVTSAQWGATAQELINAIRSVDKKHSILFGDAQWYSIELLAKRTPFTDDNIIYVIHTYEPFVFTHQGGSWTDYAAVKHIMFPYDKEKWSEYSADFGVSAQNKSKVLSSIKQYYKTGNKEAIMNGILKAKKWAATNNVPVIINEFGALRDKSDEQSVLNYYKAMAEICDTLQIPWTHWGYTGGFSVINDEGKIYDGLAEAMGLANE